MSAAALLAGAAARTDVGSAPPAVRDRVVDLVADCVAVTALGSCREELRRLVDDAATWAGDGSATVVGSSRGWAASEAAFLNGSAVAADQLQDGHRLARGHPASHVVPAVLAVAEERDVGGADVLSAVLAGYETGVRVGRAMGGTPDGVHDIGTWGAVAAAVGVARLLAPGDTRHDRARTRAVGLRRPAHRRPHRVRRSRRLARLPGHVGRHRPAPGRRRRRPASRPSRARSSGTSPPSPRATGSRTRWCSGVDGHGWQEHEVLGGYVKAHPTCAHLHGVNDAVQDLLAGGAARRRRRGRRGAGGRRRRCLRRSGRLGARCPLQRPDLVAVALADRSPRRDDAGRRHGRRPRTSTRLASLVRVVHDPALDAGSPAGRPAAVAGAAASTDGAGRTARASGRAATPTAPSTGRRCGRRPTGCCGTASASPAATCWRSSTRSPTAAAPASSGARLREACA